MPDTATTPAADALPAPAAGASGTLRRDSHPRRRRHPRLRAAAGWLLLAIAVVALWPAQWGGLTGLTIVNGHSMEPTYVTNDLVISVRQPGYSVGDIVSFRVPEDQNGAGGTVIHRIATVSGEGDDVTFTTQGDNNPNADPWTIAPRDVLGRAVVHVPAVGFLLSPEGMPFVLGGVLGVLVMVLLWGRDEDDEAEDGETDPDAEDAGR